MKTTFIIILGVLTLSGGAVSVAGSQSTDAAPISSETHAALQSQTFAIEKMTCAACPITVKKAMKSVKGVHSVEVNFKTKTATANFDPAITDIATIAAASTNAGYPAKVQSGDDD